MRTTVDLDPELHAEALAVARRDRVTLGDVLNGALRSKLRPRPPVRMSENSGLAVVRIGRPITPEDVADALDDE